MSDNSQHEDGFTFEGNVSPEVKELTDIQKRQVMYAFSDQLIKLHMYDELHAFQGLLVELYAENIK